MKERHLAQPRKVMEMPRRETSTLRPDTRQRRTLPKDPSGIGKVEGKAIPSKSWEMSDRTGRPL